MSGDYKNFQTYIRQNHNKQKPKELFIKIGEILKNHETQLGENVTVLDVGCATGALVGYLQDELPMWRFTGVDISPGLIDLARERVDGANFEVGSATDLPAVVSSGFDVVLCVGVLGIFDEEDARKVVTDSIALLNPGGLAVFIAQFNEHDVDVQIKHRKARGAWEGGWSIYSQETLRSWIGNSASSVHFEDFVPSFDLEPDVDPIRTWTIDVNGHKRLTNGAKLLVDLRVLQIVK